MSWYVICYLIRYQEIRFFSRYFALKLIFFSIRKEKKIELMCTLCLTVLETSVDLFRGQTIQKIYRLLT